MSSVIVKCSNIAKEYDIGQSKVQALRGIDLDVYEGEIFMLVGPSGCGKTTLISIIAGILNPTGGDCFVMSHNLCAMEDKEKIEFRAKNIGFVFQSYNLLPALTAAENVAVPLFINNMEYNKSIKIAGGLLDKVGLADKHNAKPTELSGGQMQRVAIARALSHNPKLVVCDEPTSALDEVSGTNVMQLMSELAKSSNLTMIVVTHDNRIFHFADRIGHVNDGKITQIEISKR